MKRFADCHIHIRSQRTSEVLTMLNEVASMGITDASILALPSCYSISENLAALYYKTIVTNIRVRAFGGLHLTDTMKDIPYEQQVASMLKLGCDGIKLYDMKPEMHYYNGKRLDGPAYQTMFSLLEQNRTPVLLHANDPLEMWQSSATKQKDGLSIYRGLYLRKPYPSHEEIFNECCSMLDQHPNLNIAFAHFFFLSNNLERAVRFMEKYPNAKLDLAPGTDMFFHFMENLSGWHDFFTTYSDRILFGTDCNTYKDFNKEIISLVYTFLTHDSSEFQMPCYGNWMIRGLGLDDKAVRNICFNSYQKFVGRDFVSVDRGGLYECAEKMLMDLKKNPRNPYYAGAEYLFEEYPDPNQQDAICFLTNMLQKGK